MISMKKTIYFAAVGSVAALAAPAYADTVSNRIETNELAGTPTFWGTEVTFSPFPGDLRPQVTALSDGTFAIVWERDGVDIVGRHFDALGGFTGGDFLSALSSSAARPIFLPKIFEQADGRVVVNYTAEVASGNRDIRWHSPNPTFTPPHSSSFGTESTQTNGTVSDDILLDSIARVGGGAANVYQFTAFGSTDLVLRFTDAIGNQASNRTFVGPAGENQQNPALAARHTGFVNVAFENVNPTTFERDIRLQTYAPNEMDVPPGEVTASASGVGASFPDIAALRGASQQLLGPFVVAWQQTGGIAFRHFNGNANPITPPLLVPSSSPGLLPKITALNDPGFIIAWTGIVGTESDGSPDLEVFLQRFDEDGNTIGTRVQIDKPGDQGLFGMSIATLDDGRVILAYESETGDSANITTLNYRIFLVPAATIISSAVKTAR